MYEQSPFTGPLARCSIPRGPCPRSRSLRSRERWESAVPRDRNRSPIDESDRFPSAIAVIRRIHRLIGSVRYQLDDR